MFTSLRDHDLHVRKSTLMVLTHLILNDMIKVCMAHCVGCTKSVQVKGQISEMAVCLEDSDPRIAGLAKYGIEVSFHNACMPVESTCYCGLYNRLFSH